MLTQERLTEVLEYDEQTGAFTWRVPPRRGTPAGVAAGCRNARGYVVIRVDGVLHMAHRLAWLYATGEWPAGEVDHKNGQRDDNKLGNLRPVTGAINSQNRRRANRNSTTGLLGANLHRGKYQASIMVGGKKTYLGTFPTATEAHVAYLTAKRQIHPGNTL